MKFRVIFILLDLFLVFAEARIVGPCVSNVPGRRCSAPNANWQRDGVCIEQNSQTACHVPDTRHYSFNLVVRLQERGDRTVTNLWVRGFGPQLSWERPQRMRTARRNSHIWSMTISYASDSNAILCVNSSYCSWNQKALELRIYKSELMDMDADMKGPNIFIPLPISKSMKGATDFSEPVVRIYPWFDGTSVRAETITLPCHSAICKLDSRLRSTILYPPSFDFNIVKRYPLVVMFGTNETSHIAPLLEHMYTHEASIEEAVVVSIHYLDEAPFCAFNPYDQAVSLAETSAVWKCRAEESRSDCYTCQNCWDTRRPTKCTANDFLSKSRRCLTRSPCSGSAGDILDLIESVLIPELQERTQNRLKLDFPKQRISVIGFNGAGLLACFAAISRPWYYANAACMSAPFQWPLGYAPRSVERNLEGIGNTMTELAATLSSEPANTALYMSQKYYIDNGEFDNFHLPVFDAHEYTQWMMQLLTSTLHLRPENFLYFNVPNGGNNYVHVSDGGLEVWNRIRQPLIFFLRAEGGPNKNFARIPKIDESLYTDIGLDEVENISQIYRPLNTMMGYCAFHKKPSEENGISPQAFAVSIGEK